MIPVSERFSVLARNQVAVDVISPRVVRVHTRLGAADRTIAAAARILRVRPQVVVGCGSFVELRLVSGQHVAFVYPPHGLVCPSCHAELEHRGIVEPDALRSLMAHELPAAPGLCAGCGERLEPVSTNPE
jgi:hypothetical protein